MLARNTFQPAEKPGGLVAPRRMSAAPMQSGRQGPIAAMTRGGSSLSGFAKRASRSAAAGWLGLAVALAAAPAHGQGAPAPPSRPWLDPALLPAAKAEGTLIVYSSTNEQEGLPLFRLFTEATGIKVEYVRASDAVLMSRMAIEFRADQKSWDILHTGTINKMPPAMLAPIEPPEAQNIFAEARDPNKRWYGVYANYNAPAYNTQKVKASELPKSYEEFAQRKEWAGKVAIDGTDNEWLKAMLQHYGEQKGTQIVKDIVAALKPVVTDGHLALARATGAGEYWVSLNNYVNLSMNVKLAGNPDRGLGARSGGAVLRPGRRELEGAASERGAARRQFHAQPGMRAVPRSVRTAADPQGRGLEPARHRRHAHRQEGHHRADDTGRRPEMAAAVRPAVSGAVSGGDRRLIRRRG